MGNIVNRVFDSSGPEGKVRGTPQQIIDKYTQLARDATLGNDRVAAENFQQHAEHYTRMLGEALREQEARREQQEQNRGNQNSNRDRDQGNDKGNQKQSAVDPGSMPQPETNDADIVEVPEGANTGLVETPESAEPKKRARRPRPPKPEANEADAPDSGPAPEAAE